jgi:hypothetical protein
VPGHRILLEADVRDRAGIQLVRCYFKADAQAEYVFVPMTADGTHQYRAVLPAPASHTEQIRYLFLVVNSDKQVVKTLPFRMEKMEEATEVPDWQQVSQETDVAIYTELVRPPEQLAGFSDSIAMDMVESSLRFGMVAGIYSASAAAAAGEATGAAAAATSAGSISAATGLSTTAILATAAGVAAGAGAVAAAGGGGGGDGEGEEDTLNPNAAVSWGAAGIEQTDAFRAVFGDRNLGTATDVLTYTGLPVGEFDLAIEAVSIAEAPGTVFVELSGGAYFRDDGGTQKEAALTEGERVVYPVFVPDTGSARIEW